MKPTTERDMGKALRIAVDFDGTIVEHDFPRIGAENPGAIEWLKRWQEAGAILILWTMRSDGDRCGDVLAEAVEYCQANGIEFNAVNQGVDDREWTTSQKAYAHIYVDDAAFGCPLIPSQSSNNFRPMVDWSIVGPEIMERIANHG